MSVSYDDAMAPLRAPVDASFAATVEADLAEAYDLTFGLGEKVAARRAELHLSQTQLADAAGIPQADISRIERGNGNPTLATVGKLLEALNLHLRVEPGPGVQHGH
jgi:DNA-binding XRE family transcriptional regulator